MEDNKDFVAKTQEQKNLDIMKKIITDNEIDFDVQGTKYKVSGLTFSQRNEINTRKVQKYMELFQKRNSDGSKTYMLEEDLKKEYKSRGIDVELMKKKILEINKQKENYQVKLGSLLKENNNQKELEDFRDQINKCDEEMNELAQRRASLLEYSIENQVNVDIFSHMIFMVTQRLVKEEGKEDVWIPAWSNKEEFGRVRENVLNVIAVYVSLIANPNIEM